MTAMPPSARTRRIDISPLGTPKARTALPTPRPRARKLRFIDKVKATFFVLDAKGKLKIATLLAAIVGFIIGGFAPFASFRLVHFELQSAQPIHAALLLLGIVACLVFSARSVYSVGLEVLENDKWKSLGLVGILETSMVISDQACVHFTALLILVAVNGICGATSLMRPTSDQL